MSEALIVPFSLEHEKELREIFFESSSRKEFRDLAEREAFYWKYLGFYLAHYPDFVFVARSNTLLGYCLGAPRTYELRPYEIQPHLKIFEDLFDRFPAHFHINCHADARGQGIGARLLGCFEEKLIKLSIFGVHLMTSPESRNRSFYSRMGYSFESLRSGLLLLGKEVKH